MKVILLEDVRGLGKKGDVKEVSDGYARNSLIPKKQVIEATAANLNIMKKQADKKAEREAKELDDAKSTAEKLQNAVIKLSCKCGEKGRLFGSVTNNDIAEALKEAGYNIDKRKIEIPDAIKTIGSYEIIAKLHSKVHVKFTVNVVAAE